MTPPPPLRPPPDERFAETTLPSAWRRYKGRPLPPRSGLALGANPTTSTDEEDEEEDEEEESLWVTVVDIDDSEWTYDTHAPVVRMTPPPSATPPSKHPCPPCSPCPPSKVATAARSIASLSMLPAPLYSTQAEALPGSPP